MDKTCVCNGKEYPVSIEFRRGAKRLSARLSRDGASLRVVVPFYYRALPLEVNRFVAQALPKLLARRVDKEPDYAEGFLYVFGKKVEVGGLCEEEIDAYLKSHCLAALEERVRYYEGLMGIARPYKVILRSMSSRYGVNSASTHRLSFTTRIVCYSWDVVDSLIVHELAHDFERNHQKRFYDIVYRYCPDYDAAQRKLKKGIHA